MVKIINFISDVLDMHKCKMIEIRSHVNEYKLTNELHLDKLEWTLPFCQHVRHIVYLLEIQRVLGEKVVDINGQRHFEHFQTLTYVRACGEKV